MPPDVVFGNAQAEGAAYRGWFIGHFIDSLDLRRTTDIEVKWGVHLAGDCRSQWSVNQTATTLSILIQGQFRIQFPDCNHLLTQPGDYVIWSPGVAHHWLAEKDSTVLSVRFPSQSSDNIEIGGKTPQNAS